MDVNFQSSTGLASIHIYNKAHLISIPSKIFEYKNNTAQVFLERVLKWFKRKKFFCFHLETSRQVWDMALPVWPQDFLTSD